MAAGDYGYGIQDLIQILPALISGETTKDRSSSAAALQKLLTLLSSSTNLVDDPMWAVMSGAYAPPAREEFVLVSPYTDSYLSSNNQVLADTVRFVSEGKMNPTEAAVFLASDPSTKALAESAGAVGDKEVAAYWEDKLKPVITEAADNAQRYNAWKQDLVEKDPFVKRGLPSAYETYGLEADPERMVQELPYDKTPLKYFEEAARIAEARGASPKRVTSTAPSVRASTAGDSLEARYKNALAGGKSPGDASTATVQLKAAPGRFAPFGWPTMVRTMKEMMMKGSDGDGALGGAAVPGGIPFGESGLQGSTLEFTPNRNQALVNMARNEARQYQQAQLDAALARGRTPLKDNLSNRFASILSLLAQSA